MGQPKITLQVPVTHTITLDSSGRASESSLHGQLSCSNIPAHCDVQITLVRVGRLKRGDETKHDTASKKFMSELGFMGSQKEQRQREFDYETAEKLCGCFVSLPQGIKRSKTAKCDFELSIPPYLPSTAALPSVDISYAIFATCVMPNGKISQAHENLRIIREHAEAIHFEPSRTVSFPETSFTVRANFESPDLRSNSATIPTTLQLNGLKLSMNSSMRATETRWLVPREIKWVFEESAIIVTGFPDSTGHIPMSTTKRILKKRVLATGKEKLKLRYPFTRPGNTYVRMLSDNTGMEVPFTVTVPKDNSPGDSTALSVSGGHILHTVRCCNASPDPNLPQKRFAVYLEYKLNIWLRIGEDVFDEASGDLVNRKIDEMAYTIVCPLTTLHSAHAAPTDPDHEPAPLVPPSYDGAWEQLPPEYTMYS
ncbi:hypothetical protein OPT61_g2377 [Boeremia exigua]|uniref:Uncharacterized protein n=1 Tax=Boeremia exigua TaxID=749465 RepID=A0ACC2ILZ1_9PLEO|nr:hypothetical protein OPT61_g2377 [Boeremia exigua]